jgi:hypothetical protein
MPNFDAGHYFLTALAPVRLDSVLIDGQSHSRRHLIREVLATIPTGERTVASLEIKPKSPFARATRTHFARFIVLDDVVFNARVSGDSLIRAVLGNSRLVTKWRNLLTERWSDPLVPQPVDRLSNPYLIFVTDFDADSAADYALKDYLTELWNSMPEELTGIFQHCVGFDAVKTDDDFFQYIKKCQIETTMPFNDYWATAPGLHDLNLKPYLYGALGLAALALIGLVRCKAWLFFGALAAIAGVAWFAYRAVMDKAHLPLPKAPPPAPAPDLPTVLKALYVQRRFTQFAIASQGRSDQELYDSFGAFAAENKPNDVAAATQLPGVIGISTESLAQ